MSVQIATRVDEDQARTFRETTQKLGTTPADALRMFVSAFNAYKGFPYAVCLTDNTQVEAFNNEEDANEFADHLAKKMIQDAR